MAAGAAFTVLDQKAAFGLNGVSEIGRRSRSYGRSPAHCAHAVAMPSCNDLTLSGQKTESPSLEICCRVMVLR